MALCDTFPLTMNLSHQHHLHCRHNKLHANKFTAADYLIHVTLTILKQKPVTFTLLTQ